MIDFPFGIFGLVWSLLWIWVIVDGVLKLFGLRESRGQVHWHNRENWWISWKKLAETNDLSFISGKFSNGPKVVGKYRNHHLTLKGSESYTQLTVVTNNQASDGASPTSSGILRAPLNVDDVARLFSLDELKHNIWGKISATAKGGIISYEQIGIETSTKYLQFLFDWLTDIADAYLTIVALGGEAIPHLHAVAEKSTRMRPLVTQLLVDIANETKTRPGNGAKDLICPRCLTACGEHEVKLSWWQSITYYGCRTCHQSRKFFEGWVVALLDNRTTEEQVQQNRVLRVNWLSRRALFDFDEVEIVQATDEDVERFAVQVGNDTDPLRKPRYRQMRCVVSAGCGLSENSHRILQRMFGSVELRPAFTNLDHIADGNGLKYTIDERLVIPNEMRV